MQLVNRVSGRVAGIPYSKNVVSIDTGDVAQVIDAATGLIKVVGGAALAGVAIYAGARIMAAILDALVSGVTSVSQSVASARQQTILVPPQPTLPLGCGPVWIETPESKFWGILLDSTLKFNTNAGNPLEIELAKISGLYGKKEDGIHINLVDGSTYGHVWPYWSDALEVATLGGKQMVPLKTPRLYKLLWWSWYDNYEYVDVNFRPSTVSDVTSLKNNLQRALSQNGAAITQLIGPNILQTYFNVPKIGP